MKRSGEIYKVTIIGSICNLLLLIFKFVAGIIGQSAAMIADAVHSLSDFVTDIIVILFVRISGKPQDKDHEYGHGKYETLATALIGIILFGVGVGIMVNGITSVWDFFAKGTELEKPGPLAFIAAVLSILTKEILYRYTVSVGRKVNSQTVIANAWHHRSDAFSSIGTATGIGGALLLGPGWQVLDPLAAIIVSFFIIRVAYGIGRQSLEELMEKSLPEELEEQIRQALMETDAASDPHNLRTRKIGNSYAVDVHVRMDGELTVRESHEITRTMEQRIRRILGPNSFISIHVEPAKPSEDEETVSKSSV